MNMFLLPRNAARHAAVAAALICAAAAPAIGQTAWPARPIRIVVPYATGGGSDILARQIGVRLQEAWGQAVVVENKAGASGSIGTQEVVHAAADGHTLLLQNSTMATQLGLLGKLPYDPAKDLTPILLLGLTPMALVAHPGAGIGSVKELVAAAKAAPKSLAYGSCGIGTPQHFAMELVKEKTGIAATHAGYKGCAPAMTDALGGHVPLAIVSANLVVPHVASGALRVVGVSTARRYAQLPDAPTFEEQGLKPFDFSIWYALMGPAKLPPAVVAKLGAEVERILGEPATRAKLSAVGVEVRLGSAQELARLVETDARRYAELARSADIKAE